MKSNDLLYLAVIGGLGYLLYQNSQKPTTDAGTSTDGGSESGTPPPTVLPNPMSTALIGDCPLDFSIPYGTIGNSTKYSSIDGKYYRQAMGSAIRSVPAEISLLEFQNACKDFKALMIIEKKKDEIVVMPFPKPNLNIEAVTNFSGTLYRGIM